MHKKLQFNLIFVVTLALSIITISQLISPVNAQSQQKTFSAKLTGINEAPPISTLIWYISI